MSRLISFIVVFGRSMRYSISWQLAELGSTPLRPYLIAALTEKDVFSAYPLPVADFELRSLALVISTDRQICDFLLRPDFVLLANYLLLGWGFLWFGLDNRRRFVLLAHLSLDFGKWLGNFLLLAVAADVSRVQHTTLAVVFHNVLLLLLAHDELSQRLQLVKVKHLAVYKKAVNSFVTRCWKNIAAALAGLSFVFLDDFAPLVEKGVTRVLEGCRLRFFLNRRLRYFGAESELVTIGFVLVLPLGSNIVANEYALVLGR